MINKRNKINFIIYNIINFTEESIDMPKFKKLVFRDHPEFKPNLTPREIFELGAFGGTYWRPIHSTVTGKNHRNNHRKYDFFDDLPNSVMTLPWEEYDRNINKYKVKVGATLEEWEDSGWIVPQDPYGWVQWYCEFYNGRRMYDDERQIDRWLGVASKERGRFKIRLDNMLRDGKDSPKIRQTLLHWAVLI
jgi:hypothetical protein